MPQVPTEQELRDELAKPEYDVSLDELGEWEMRYVQLGAKAALNLRPAAPEFQIKHDSDGCSGVVRGYIRIGDNGDYQLELECLSCDKGPWVTQTIP